MSNGFTLELAPWGDGTTRLAFWDYLSGQDEIYLLNEDGTAGRAIDEGENESVVVEPVNLVTALRELADRLYGDKDGA